MLRNAGSKTEFAVGGIRRLAHSLAQPAPLGTAINHQINDTLLPFVLPENNDDENRNAECPNSPLFGGAMELMAVPKKKTTPHKRGIRNGPKALKPVPVIIRCKVCGFESSYRTSSVAVGSSQILNRIIIKTVLVLLIC